MIDWLEAHMGTCTFVTYFNIECPGCGIQRAFIALLRGDLALSFRFFPALLPYLATILLMVMHLIFKFKNGALYAMWGFMLSVGIMVVSYIVKLVFR
ncbi:MAG: DUF2752 domain-containing protein [Sphingobacteriaceae bacterium]|nr:DUF2752 domain-containing protein [Sphingobacteriaceae bacterium]